MSDFRKTAVIRVVTAFCVMMPLVCLSAAEDEMDTMLNVESSIKNNGAQKKVEVKAEKTAEPVKAFVVAPASPAVRKVQPKPEEKKAAVTRKDTVIEKPVESAVHVTAPDNNIETLRLELRLREIELAKANKEIERLKDIVRRIQEANRRESVVLHYNKASVYRSSMMYKKAEEEYIAALTFDPNDAGVHYNLAILYDDNMKDRKKAKLHYEKFLDLAPDDPDAAKVRDWLTSIIE